ncbi:hypothetical protein L7F22_040381 [Adiantum nelumboides]|nr:hypothetical protein [Adiantum nelumboides]
MFKESVSLSNEDNQRTEFLEKYNDCFTESLPDLLPPKRPEDHKIDLLPGSSPPTQPPYRVSLFQQEEIMKQVSELLEKGLTTGAHWSFPTTAFLQFCLTLAIKVSSDTSFSHHCRCCGKSVCNEHSSNQVALPQFGIKSAVRVCDDCFRGSKQINGEEGSVVINAATATDSLARLNLSPDDGPSSEKETAFVAPQEQLQECTCGMPLCICQIPSVTPVALDIPVVTPIIPKKLPAVFSGESSAVKRVPTRPSYSNELPSLFFSNTKSNNVGGQIVSKKYESTGEGIWEAIKNGDAAAVKDLLATGVNANHQDKQGMSLLHLAAVFNSTDIVFLLMDAGANVAAKNAQGTQSIILL